MSIKRKEIDKDGFKATLFTVSCEDSGGKMFEILCRDENKEGAPVSQITGKWARQEGSGSGPHEIQGLLSYGPIETKRYMTQILDVVPDNAEADSLDLTVYVQEVDPEPEHEEED